MCAGMNRPRRATLRQLAFGALVALVAGCNRTQTANEALKKSFEVNGGTQQNIVKFSGTVTVDGQTPVIDRRNPFVVMAYDPKKPPKGRQMPFSANCDKNGHFEFNSYGTGDGLPTGSYIVIFAQPKPDGDGLKNLYNDPDQNVKDNRFKIELSGPGRTDWNFDLVVTGKDPVTTPGEHAVLADRGKKKRG